MISRNARNCRRLQCEWVVPRALRTFSWHGGAETLEKGSCNLCNGKGLGEGLRPPL